MPKDVLNIVDTALLESKFIAKTAIEYLINKTPADQKEIKNYKRLRRFRKFFETITGSKTYKLFESISKWKKSLKTESVKALRKLLRGPKVVRNPIKSSWKGSKYFVSSIFKNKTNIQQVALVNHGKD